MAGFCIRSPCQGSKGEEDLELIYMNQRPAYIPGGVGVMGYVVAAVVLLEEKKKRRMHDTLCFILPRH
jgi:hypothetical protein